MTRGELHVCFPSSLGVQDFENAISAQNPLDSGVRGVIFDYSRVTFVPLDTHVHSLCLYNQLAHSGAAVELRWPEDQTISYANRMGFFQVLDTRVRINPRRPAPGLAKLYRAGSPTLLELTSVHLDDRKSAEEILRLIYDRVMANVSGTPSADSITGHVCTVATELVNNIFDWSHTPLPGLIGMQRYQNRVALTIADCGVGITASIRENSRARVQALSDQQIIQSAFRDGLSSRPDPGGGAGLTRCAEIAARYQGRLTVRTNRTWSKLIVKAKRSGLNWNVYEPNAARIDGTILSFELLLDRLQVGRRSGGGSRGVRQSA